MCSFLLLTVFAMLALWTPLAKAEFWYGPDPELVTKTKMMTWPDGSHQNITTFLIRRGANTTDTRERWRRLDKTHSEYVTVAEFIPKKHTYSYIYRNENVFLWHLYRTERRKMRGRGVGGAERMLWFAIDDRQVTNEVDKHGFNVSAAHGMLGDGLHFYTKYEDAAVRDSMDRYRVLLTRVALGVECNFSPGSAPEGCDSVRSDDGTVYAVFRPGQAYPKYDIYSFG